MYQLFEAIYSTADEAARVRRNLVDALLGAGLAMDRVDLAAVMTSELMANALSHTETPNPLVAAFCDDLALKVMVTDAGTGAPVLRPLDAQEVGGNGMRIVQAFAQDWGTVIHDGLGKSVWFSIDLPPLVATGA